MQLNGWAIENRVYAEDPVSRLPAVDRPAGALPAAGRDDATTTACVRVDDGVAEGGEVCMFYDPMIAKLITWAPTREEAIDAQIAALDAFEIDGHRPQYRFPVGADAAPALPRRARSPPASSPRNIPTASTARRPTPELTASARRDRRLRRDRARPIARGGSTASSASGLRAAVATGRCGSTAPSIDVSIVDRRRHRSTARRSTSRCEYTPGDRLVEAEIDDERR